MFKNILVPVDLANDDSNRAVAVAVEIAKATKDARVRLLNITAPTTPVVAQYLPEGWADKVDADNRQRLAKIAAANGLKEDSVRLRHGVVFDEVLAEARETKADLIVMASHHPEFSDYLLGSNATTVVRHADCSVLVLRK